MLSGFNHITGDKKINHMLSQLRYQLSNVPRFCVCKPQDIALFVCVVVVATVAETGCSGGESPVKVKTLESFSELSFTTA